MKENTRRAKEDEILVKFEGKIAKTFSERKYYSLSYIVTVFSDLILLRNSLFDKYNQTLTRLI